MRINGAVAVVTGASGGIGRATAHALAEQGARVVVTARRAEALAEVVAECAEIGAEALAVPADVTDAEAVAEVARTARERFGALDIWVNCAAVSAFGLFEQTPMEVHRRVLEVNVLGYLHGAAAALPYLRERPQGVLVNVSSVIGVTPQPYTGAYTVSKAAVQAFSAVLRQELWLQGDRGVRVCAVLPAAVDTPVFRQAANYTGHAVRPIAPRYRPQWVARSVVRVIRRPRAEVISGPAGRPVVLAGRLLRRPVERIAAVVVRREHLAAGEPAERTAGNLFHPAAGRGAVSGGWLPDRWWWPPSRRGRRGRR